MCLCRWTAWSKITQLTPFLMARPFTFTAAPSSGTGNIFVNYLAPQGATITPAAENKGNFKGGGLFRTNAQSLTANTTILATENANVTGPFTVASGVTLTVESGGTLVTL